MYTTCMNGSTDTLTLSVGYDIRYYTKYKDYNLLTTDNVLRKKSILVEAAGIQYFIDGGFHHVDLCEYGKQYKVCDDGIINLPWPLKECAFAKMRRNDYYLESLHDIVDHNINCYFSFVSNIRFISFSEAIHNHKGNNEDYQRIKKNNKVASYIKMKRSKGLFI